MAPILRLLDPTRILQCHRQLYFRSAAKCGRNVYVTHRAELLLHGKSCVVQVGAHTIVDGTLECYERGHLDIGEHVFIGRSRIYAAYHMRIGNNVLISDGVAIMDSDLHPRDIELRRRQMSGAASGLFPDVYSEVSGAKVEIGDDAWIGFGATVLKGVRIGRGAIIGARTVVTKDVPPLTVVAGFPAAIVGHVEECMTSRS
jgi:acetyltransferase-like isoleucine patch superfamily enzyme